MGSQAHWFGMVILKLANSITPIYYLFGEKNCDEYELQATQKYMNSVIKFIAGPEHEDKTGYIYNKLI
jgi:hypothetical protein